MAQWWRAVCLAGVLTAGAVLGPLPSAFVTPSAAVTTPTEAATSHTPALLRLSPTRSEVRIGETVAFVAEVTNPSDTDLVGLRVTGETIDTGASMLGARVSTGVFDPASATWFIGRVAPGDSATLELFARAETTGRARVVLLMAAADPTGTITTTESEVEITDWRAAPRTAGLSDAMFTAAVALVVGGALLAMAGLVHLRRRHPAPHA